MSAMNTMSTKSIIEEKIAKKLNERTDLAKSISVPVAIELLGEGGGRWLIDFTKKPALVEAGSNAPAKTTISMDAEVFNQLAAGEIDPQTAFLMGKVRVEGDLGLAIKLGQLLV